MTRAGLRNPVVVDVAIASSAVQKNDDGNDECTRLTPQEQAMPTSLTNYYVVSPMKEKMSRQVAFLKQHRDQKVVVCFLTCASVEFYDMALQKILASSSSRQMEMRKKTVELNFYTVN